MDERRPDTLRAADIPFEAELRRELAIAPSPAFVAGVRARIAAQPRGRTIGAAVWTAAGLALAASIVIAVGLFRSGHSTVSTQLSAPAGTTSAAAPAVSPAPTIAPDRVPVRDGSDTASGTTRRPNARAVPRTASDHALTGVLETPVLIDPRALAGLRRLLEMRAAAVAAQRDQSPPPSAAGPLAPATELVVSPIRINPLEAVGQ